MRLRESVLWTQKLQHGAENKPLKKRHTNETGNCSAPSDRYGESESRFRNEQEPNKISLALTTHSQVVFFSMAVECFTVGLVHADRAGNILLNLLCVCVCVCALKDSRRGLMKL